MLPIQANTAIQTNILPTQNIGMLEQNQPQVYSLLTNTNSLSLTKKPRRNKTMKLDETIPVMINPQITRNSTGVTFAVHHHRSTISPGSISPFLSTHLINDPSLQHRFYIENSYDANNNINHNQIQSLSMSLNGSSPTQTQQTSIWSNDSLSTIHTNSLPQLVAQSQLFGINRLLNHNIDERTVLVPSTQRNIYKHLHPPLTFTDQGSLLDHSHSLPISLSPISTSAVPLVKPKRKYSKRIHPPAPTEQQLQPSQQIPQGPTSPTQSTTSNGLPSIIPAFVTRTHFKSEELSFPIDKATTPNFVSLTPPASISSTKSSPTEINNESSLMPIQQHSPPRTTTDIVEVNSRAKQYFHNQGFSYIQRTSNDLSTNNLPYNLHRLLAAAHLPQYCTVSSNVIPTNILPMTSPSTLPDTITTTHPLPTPVGTKKERKKRDKGVKKSKVTQNPMIKVLADEKTLPFKSLRTDMSMIKKQKHLKSNPKDIRTKKELRRITYRNRLAVLKFMMRKRKQQKQERISIPKLPDVKAEPIAPPKLINTHMAKPDKLEADLPDIIAPSLRIFLDASQKVESISLYYHRRRRPNITNESSSITSANADNKLGLLIEAVDFIETLDGSSKLAALPVK